MMRVDEITEGSRVKWLENRSNIESARSEVCRTRIWFDVATEKKECTKKRITSAQTARARRNEGEQSGCQVQMGKFLTCSEVRDTLIMLLERRVERRRGDSVK